MGSSPIAIGQRELVEVLNRIYPFSNFEFKNNSEF